jgi:hypothetical protein
MKIKNKVALWLGAAVLAVLAFTGKAQALNPQPIEIHVSINATKSVTASATYYDYGATAVDVATVSATALTVTNASLGLVETYVMSAGNAIADVVGTDWTLAASTGSDTYSLAAQFSTVQPSNAFAAWDATDYLTTTPQACTATRFGNGTGAQSGLNVNPAATRNLWFRLHTPGVVTDPSAHTATVTLGVQ